MSDGSTSDYDPHDEVIDEDHRYCTHILSKRSRALDRDTFVFWPSLPADLLVGKHVRF
jgi:hypothetical protein